MKKTDKWALAESLQIFKDEYLIKFINSDIEVFPQRFNDFFDIFKLEFLIFLLSF